MARKQAFPFAEDEVVLSRDGFFGQLENGEEVVVPIRTRMRSSNPIVHRWPELFVRDGMPLTPLDRPEPEPSPDDRDPRIPKSLTLDSPNVLRVLRNYRAFASAGHGKQMVEFHAGQLVQSHMPVVALIRKTDRELFDSLFEKPSK